MTMGSEPDGACDRSATDCLVFAAPPRQFVGVCGTERAFFGGVAEALRGELFSATLQEALRVIEKKDDR